MMIDRSQAALPESDAVLIQPSVSHFQPPSSATVPPGRTHVEQREQVRRTLRSAREWLEECEPSSPVAVLLKQAERLLGRRFAEVAQAIPPELLAQWDAES